MKFTVTDSLGEISSIINSPDRFHAELNTPSGHTLHSGLPPYDACYWSGALGTWIQKPARPSDAHVWDAHLKQWADTRSLDDLRHAKWEEIKVWRQAEIDNPILQTTFGAIDVGPKALANINKTLIAIDAAARMGEEPVSIWWTMADNTAVEISPGLLRSVAVMLLARSNEAHAKSRVLRQQIFDPTTTPHQLEAISWPASA